MKIEIRDCEFGRLSSDDAEDFFLDLVDVMTKYGVLGLDGGAVRIGASGAVSVRDFTVMTSTSTVRD